MDYVETKYINLLSIRLEHFKRKGNNLYNFRCPICGDSHTNKNKARGYIFERKGKSIYHCHNCGITLSISNLIKRIDPSIYSAFLTEKFEHTNKRKEVLEDFTSKMKKPVFMKDESPLKGLVKVSSLADTDPVRKLVLERKIPSNYHYKLFSCPKFMAYSNKFNPGKFSDEALKYDSTRLLIPFINKDGVVHAYQGRALNDDKVKYITIVLDESIPKIYGLDTVNEKEDIYVLEGPIDSMFIHNSIATAGGDLVAAVREFDNKKLVIVYDNEPRSKETVKKIRKAIKHGLRVVIWPEGLECKDVNEMVQNGLTKEGLQHILYNNTYEGLEAELQLMKWSKI